MKPDETSRKTRTPSSRDVPQTHTKSKRSAGRYQKVLDGRKQPVRGLWRRNNRFYARMTVADTRTGKSAVRRIPLGSPEVPIDTVPQAIAELRRLKTQREENRLPVVSLTPKFADVVASYFDYLEKAVDTKRASTIAKERSILAAWKAHFGDIRVKQIHRAMINDFIANRQAAGVSARTVNLDVIALRSVLKKALDDGYLTALPTENLRPLKTKATKRELFSAAEIDALCVAALANKPDGTPVTKNGRQFSDYVRFLALSGARRNEALSIRWADIDLNRKQVTIGANEATKNGEIRVVDFNQELEAHLAEMVTRRAPDSEWLFPSPQRGAKDVSARSFKESLNNTKQAAKKAHPRLAQFGFHDCRHYFISHCVMSGIDYMTIAKWVGHKDGGVLIGKVYGHLNDAHAKRQAQRVSFQLHVFDEEEAAA